MGALDPLPAQARLLTWDWREQPDIEALARIVSIVSGGLVRVEEIEDTGSDQFAIVVSNRDDVDVAEIWRQHVQAGTHNFHGTGIPRKAQ